MLVSSSDRYIINKFEEPTMRNIPIVIATSSA